MPSAGKPMARKSGVSMMNAPRGMPGTAKARKTAAKAIVARLARVQRDAVEPADEQRADGPRHRRRDLERGDGERQHEAGHVVGDRPSPRSALSTSAGSDAIEELELNAMSCDGSAARREAAHRNAGEDARRPDRAAA